MVGYTIWYVKAQSIFCKDDLWVLWPLDNNVNVGRHETSVLIYVDLSLIF